MATFSKPLSVPRWADTSGNVIEPPEAKKDAGWLFQEIPPSPFENWKEKLNGEWWKWVNERFADGVSADELDILDPATTNPMAHISGTRFEWLSNVGREIEAVPSRVTAGRSQTDGINLFGVGNIKGITFDSNLNQLRYDIVNDEFEFRCNSGAPSLRVTESRVEALRPLVVGSANPTGTGGARIQNGLAVGAPTTNPLAGQGIFGAHIRTGSDAAPNAAYSILDRTLVGVNDDSPSALTPLACTGIMIGNGVFRLLRTVSEEEYQLQFEGSDNMIEYDNVDEEMRFFIGGINEFKIAASHVQANTFVPLNAGGRDVNRYEVSRRNQICLAAKVTFIGPGLEPGSRPWNIDGVNLPSAGVWEVLADEILLDDALPIVTINESSNIYRASAFYSDAGNYVGVRTTNTGNGLPTSVRFNLIVVAG